MNKSLDLVIESLEKFDLPGFKEDHEALFIEIPQGFLRYRRLSDSGGMTDDMIIYLTYKDRGLSFSVKLAARSKVKAPRIVRAVGGEADGLQQFIIEPLLELSLGDARKLFFYLLEVYGGFTISVKTIKRKYW